jgi:hypothetical protein
MLRLAHRLLTQTGVSALTQDEAADHAFVEETKRVGRRFKAAVSSARVVIADNVAVYAEHTKEKWKFTDFPNVMPPFNNMFIEWNSQQVASSRTPFDERDGHPLQIGWSIATDEIAGANRNAYLWRIYGDTGDSFFQLNGNKTPKWIIACTCFFTRANGLPAHLPVHVAWAAGQFGELLAINGHGNSIEVAPIMVPALLTISLMHCKNVARRDATDTEGPSDKWLRRTRQPKLRYHVLDIEPMKQVLRTEGGIEHNGLKKALHICRGHFATYTNDAPLFGKHTGTFWKPQHVRGDTKLGEVVKDYRVKL